MTDDDTPMRHASDQIPIVTAGDGQPIGLRRRRRAPAGHRVHPGVGVNPPHHLSGGFRATPSIAILTVGRKEGR